jgi:regulatory protein
MLESWQMRGRLLDAQELLHYALKSLAGRALSSAEVRIRLDRRAQSATDVDGVMRKLEEYGFLNDEKFAEHYALARRDTQGFGKIRVLRDLRQRRVPDIVAGSAVGSVFADTEENDLAEAFLARKIRGVPLPDYLKDPKHLQSAYRKLRYAGFSSSVAIRVLKKYSEHAGHLEDAGEADEIEG